MYRITELVGPLALLSLLRGVRVEGEENIPMEPRIIACNQTHNLDSFFLLYAFLKKTKRPISFVARKHRDLLRGPINCYAKSTGGIMVEKGYYGARNLLIEGPRALERGNNVGIFPEGRRVMEERLGCFEDGAARLSITTRVPIVPAYMNNYKVPLFGVATVRIGKAISPDVNGSTNREKARELTDRVKQAILELSDYPQ